MKIIAILSLAINISFAATTFSYETDKIIDNTPEKILSIITNIEQYCKNCKYQVKDVVTNEFVAYSGDNSFYSWTHSSSAAGTYKFFSYTKYQYLDSDTIVVTSGYPSKNEIKQLKRDFGLKHKAPFDEVKTTWIIRRVGNDRSYIEYSGLFVTRNLFASLFTKEIQDGIEKGTDIYIDKFFLMN